MKTMVIALVSTVFLFTFSCERSRIDTALFNSMLVSQRKAALQLEEDNDILYRNAQYLLYDESKMKYKPIGEFMENFRREIDSIRHELQQKEAWVTAQEDPNVEMLSLLLIDFHQSILYDFEKFLLTNDSIFFLKEEEIKFRCLTGEKNDFLPTDPYILEVE